MVHRDRLIATMAMLFTVVTVMATATPANASSGWSNAQQLPGIAVLNVGGLANVTSLSCGAVGSCSAVGTYTDSNSDTQAFVDDMNGGNWGAAQMIPGLATLDSNGILSVVRSVSCGAAQSCSAVGYYLSSPNGDRAFVVNRVNGKWGNAQNIPGMDALDVNTLGSDALSVSCSSAGNCSAAGFYTDGVGDQQAYVVSEVDGTWLTARTIPEVAMLNTGGSAEVTSVSCTPDGGCGATGDYEDGAGNVVEFVLDARNGAWGAAAPVSGASWPYDNLLIGIGNYSISCSSRGNCVAGGHYGIGLAMQAFIVSEIAGTWGRAEAVPGIGKLNTFGDAATIAISCVSSGDCTVGGVYAEAPSQDQEAWVADESHGSWGTATSVPGLASLNTGGLAKVGAISCYSAGNCSAVGTYGFSQYPHSQVFVDDEVNGKWQKAKELPGFRTLNAGGVATDPTISCVAPGNCATGGSYVDVNEEAFVADSVNPVSVPGAPASVTAIGTDGQVSVHWSVPSDGGSPITGYEIRVYMDSTLGETLVTAADRTTVAINSLPTYDPLPNGQEFRFQVAAKNVLGVGPFSALSTYVQTAELAVITTTLRIDDDLQVSPKGYLCYHPLGAQQCFGVQQNVFVEGTDNTLYWVQNVLIFENVAGTWQAAGANQVFNYSQTNLLHCSNGCLSSNLAWHKVRLPLRVTMRISTGDGVLHMTDSLGPVSGSEWSPPGSAISYMVDPHVASAAMPASHSAPEVVLVGEKNLKNVIFEDAAGTVSTSMILADSKRVSPQTQCVATSTDASTGETEQGLLWSGAGGETGNAVRFATTGSGVKGEGLKILPDLQRC
jgi:hypothetical protein